MATTPDTKQIFLDREPDKIIVPDFTGRYPIIQRVGENPKEAFDAYPRLSFEDSLEAIEASELSDQEKIPLIGLLSYGGVVEFPGGVGLDYKRPFKTAYMPMYASPAAELMKDTLYHTQTNLIGAPDISPLFFARDISEVSGGIDIMRIQKDGNHKRSFGFSIPSYTRGGNEPDVLYWDQTTLQDAFTVNGAIRAFVAEDIIDTGGVIEGMIDTVELMQESGLPIQIVGAGVFIEKTYTGARQRIENRLKIPIISAIKVEDLWRKDSEGRAGMKVTGVDYGLTFQKQK